ncbi:MAG: HAD family hydrolase [Christensenellales bacterium]
MLQWAGTGVAVSNAAESVQAAADMVTARNDEEDLPKRWKRFYFKREENVGY